MTETCIESIIATAGHERPKVMGWSIRFRRIFTEQLAIAPGGVAQSGKCRALGALSKTKWYGDLSGRPCWTRKASGMAAALLGAHGDYGIVFSRRIRRSFAMLRAVKKALVRERAWRFSR